MELNGSSIIEETGTMINVDKVKNIDSVVIKSVVEDQGSVVIKKSQIFNKNSNCVQKEEQLIQMIDEYGVDRLYKTSIFILWNI